MEGVQRYLNSHGFVETRPINLTDKPCFSGWLEVESTRLQLELRFEEGRFNFPHAYLSEWPYNPELRAKFGFRHINANGRVCYADESRTWWDSSMAIEMVAGVLESIRKLLLGNLSGAVSCNVIARDFSGYWDGNKSLFIARQAQKGLQFKQVKDRTTSSQWLIPKDMKTWVRVDTSESSNTEWLVLRLDKPATLLNHIYWPPKKLSHLVDWVNLNSPSSIQQLIAILGAKSFFKAKKKQENYQKRVGVLFSWLDGEGKEVLGCGASFEVPEVAAQAIAHNRLKPVAAMLKRGEGKITRYGLKQADSNYIQTRNSPDTKPLLKNKRVILIGVGTIGSQLAKLLCSHSAGWGSHGELHLVDPDIFSIENIGRHLLGSSHLNQSKALAVAESLKNDFPYLSIKAHAESIIKNWDLISDNSVVIDATGCQTVSVAIPDYLSRKNLQPLVLHSWVHGHGSATVAFLNDRKERNSACFRCLWKLENGSYKPRYSLSRHPEKDAPVFAGCHNSYHAYASTVSMLAATQAMTLLYDYYQGSADSSLRFQVLDSSVCQDRPDTSPTKTKTCPLCHI